MVDVQLHSSGKSEGNVSGPDSHSVTGFDLVPPNVFPPLLVFSTDLFQLFIEMRNSFRSLDSRQDPQWCFYPTFFLLQTETKEHFPKGK